MAYTEKYARLEIQGQILKEGGFSVFWACSHPVRAKVLDKMHEAGEIRYSDSPFPWVDAELVKDKK